ncbi:hypothetical protein EmuJ_000720400 [Echinococcus multilocularis]|uniref:Uncharacterized protein n=1 Tax=Echinococcus multilocularis TaxID=6211 RepID=A0A068Y8S7_ECHMU|nr:hypothetical protein EmuJ_000720400 [Echinococcus multilocularis]
MVKPSLGAFSDICIITPRNNYSSHLRGGEGGTGCWAAAAWGRGDLSGTGGLGSSVSMSGDPAVRIPSGSLIILCGDGNR